MHSCELKDSRKIQRKTLSWLCLNYWPRRVSNEVFIVAVFLELFWEFLRAIKSSSCTRRLHEVPMTSLFWNYVKIILIAPTIGKRNFHSSAFRFCVLLLFFKKLCKIQTNAPVLLSQMRLQRICFPVNFPNFFRKVFLQYTFQRIHLKWIL